MNVEYAKTKTKIDPKNKLPVKARALPKRGFIFIMNGRFKEDVNQTTVDFEKKSITFDYYRTDAKRLKGQIPVASLQIKELIGLSNKVWASSEDNAENGQLVQGFNGLLNLVLVDRDTYRVTGFTPRPTEAVSALYTRVMELVDPEPQ